MVPSGNIANCNAKYNRNNCLQSGRVRSRFLRAAHQHVPSIRLPALRLHSCVAAGVREHRETSTTSTALEDGYVSSCGKFYVRMIRGEDIQVVTNVQANSFHTTLKPAWLDDFSKKLFRAEVLDALRCKMQDSPTYTSAIIVAVPVKDGPDGAPVAVLEIFLSNDQAVLKHFPGDAFSPFNTACEEGYGWLSSMAVSNEVRRTGCATALLQAAHDIVREWNYAWTALHVYEDNDAAIKTYESAGYKQVHIDPIWRAWIGARRRVLMVREV